MSFTKSRLFLLFLKITIPIIIVILISGFFLYQKMENEKALLMEHSAQTFSKLISSVYKFDKRSFNKKKYNFSTDEATLLQIQSTLQNMQLINDVDFEYVVAKKTDSAVEFIAYSSEKAPPTIKLSSITSQFPMKKALDGLSGVEIQYDYKNEKVFSAFTKISDTPWGLVINQPYERHIYPYKVIVFVSIIVLIGMMVFLYQVLKFYENKSMQRIKQSDERFKQLIESTDDWVWEVNASDVYQYISPQVENILGYKPSDIIGKTPFELMSQEEANRVSKIFMDIMKQQSKIINLETTSIHKNGSEVVCLTNGTPFFDNDGTLLGYRGIDKDITINKAQEQELEQLAYYDVLTGLANRKTITNRINEELKFAKRNNLFSALIFMDLDGFKHVNDSLGHLYGDKLLKIVANRLLGLVREFDVVSRIGGDEFIILIRGAKEDYLECKKHIELLMQRIIISINEPIEIDDTISHIGVSMGVVLIPYDGNNSQELIMRADNAMYKAKALGKNRGIFFSKVLQEEADEQLNMQNEIKEAFENEEFMLYYQAQHSAEDVQRITGYEALIRWQHPIKGLLSPFKFLPFIEKFGYAAQLDKYVYNRVQQELYPVFKNNKDLRVSINLTALSFEDKNFSTYLVSDSFIDKIPLEQITLEITEETFIKNIDTSCIQTIKDLGFKISIDDFGTGYSSLSYLSSIQFDEIKLDMSFVQKIGKSDKDTHICQFILNMSKAFNVEIVAEGVETQEQLEFVSKGGATSIQGYLLGKPKAFKDIF